MEVKNAQLEKVFSNALKYDSNILLGDFNVKVRREQMYRPIIEKH